MLGAIVRALGALAVALPMVASAAVAAELAPWKDELFRYPAVLASEDNGDFIVVEYIKERDLRQRDEVPERRAKAQYVQLVPQKTRSYDVDGRSQKFIGVGKIEGGARAIVFYIHGQGGNRFQGANDWMFGGNFNRAMNLMYRNGGAYLSPDFSDLGQNGKNEIKAFIADQAARSPDAAIFVACGSQGGTICWNLVADGEAASLIDGLILLGSTHDDRFLKSPAVTGKGRQIPVFMGHGTLDTVFDWQGERDFYRAVKKADPGYPIRLAVFDSGSHGTPIRMIDWRETLNWMLTVNGR